MGLIDTLTGSSSARQAVELAHQVARRSCAAVWQKVQARVEDMSLAEARGYIRAHSAEVVQAEVQRSGCPEHHRDQVVEFAREAVVQTLASEVGRIHRTRASRRLAA